jgi:hypothetical protein
MQHFNAIFYSRVNGQLTERFLYIEAPSLARAKRFANAEKQPNERLASVEPKAQTIVEGSGMCVRCAMSREDCTCKQSAAYFL